MRIGILEYTGKHERRAIDEVLLPRLEKIGAEIAARIFVADLDGIERAFEFLFDNAQILLLCGDVSALKSALAPVIQIPPENLANIFSLRDHDIIFVPPGAGAEFLDSMVLPVVSAKFRTLFACATFRTFGLTEAAVKDALKAHIRNRSKVSVSVNGTGIDCEIRVRYSNKTGKITVDEVLQSVAEKLKDYIYTVDGMTLYDSVFELLRQRHKRLAVAESFTGGAISAKFIERDGASAFFTEGAVVYTDTAKIVRLRVDPATLERYSAVSDEAAYEMAAGILQKSGADIVLAATGYAGDAPPGQHGLAFIAAGTADGIHVYRHQFSGSRAAVIECGVQAAFYHLMRCLLGKEMY